MALEFKPYPVARITPVQWARYYDEVQLVFGGTMQELPEHRLVVFSDKDNGVSYAFTLSTHPAHPAWIARRIIGDEQKMHLEQVGYFAGEEPPFAVLFQQYQATNQRIIAELERQRGLRNRS
jgi:hypothetical protein